MHTQTKRFIARVLLLGGLLQSCYSPHVPEEAAAVSVETADNHDTDANPRTRKRKAPTLDMGSAMSGPAAQEPAASHPSTTIPKSLRLDAAEAPQEAASPTAIDQVGGPGRASASIQPEICTGTDSFDELLLESDVFVDKSLFIKEFLQGKDKVSLITRPRRWGKSLNMDMLKKFLAIEVDDQGRLLPQEQSLNRKLFVGGEAVIRPKTGKVKQLFPLKIAQQCPDLISDYQGEYPVISIGFKDIEGNSYRKIEKGIRSRIAELYSQYDYLEGYLKALGTTLGDTQQEKLCRYIRGNFTEEELKSSLRFLSELLHKYFGKGVYILIDEYDAPINNAYVECKGKPKQFRKVVKLFQSLLGATLKSNTHLKQSLVTGILRIAKANLFSGLNNIQEFTLLDEGFATCYGFTQQEVNELLTQVPVSTSSDDIRKWYNGYTFEDQVLYNPWSVMCCLRHKGRLDCYWIDSGGTQLIDEVFVSDKVQQDLQTLISGGTLRSTIKKQISFDDISETETLYSLLLFSGYLTPDTVPHVTRGHFYQLSIPNYEVKHIYEERLLKWVANKLTVDVADYRKLINLLLIGQVETFTKDLQELLDRSTSFYQTGPRHSEAFYNGFMLGLLSDASHAYVIESDRESGLGRPDTVLIPEVGHGDQALIIEYKVGKQVEQLATLAERGLAQIVDKEYDVQVKVHSHVQRILQVCIAFCGKKVAVQHTRVDLER
ncbi:MAG: AAA family ATPase [Bacteroidota bacterium]